MYCASQIIQEDIKKIKREKRESRELRRYILGALYHLFIGTNEGSDGLKNLMANKDNCNSSTTIKRCSKCFVKI